ncbi:MAG: recombinase family protein [Marinisporobacter sp.]|jgi:site-specific DNA recombinase|nr:recombinase family protein [Marinisporobacter sp.]
MNISTIAIYSRKSKATEKGESIQNQIDLCRDYAKKHFQGNNFLVYEDEGYSGGNSNRPKFQKLLKDLKKKKFQVLICYRLDRISRNISDFSGLVALLQEYNIDFVSIREQFDTSTPMGRAMMYITSVFAQLERETIAERIRDNMLALARTGRWLGGKTPMGFKSKGSTYFNVENIKKKMYHLTPIHKELELVKVFYKKYLELGSLTKLESWTLESHIKTRNNKDFDKSILKVILANPVYVIGDKIIYEYFQNLGSDIANMAEKFDGTHGLMVYNKHDEKKNRIIRKDPSEWVIAIGEHEGIIPSHEWIRVQNLLEGNRQKAPRVGTSNFGLITTLLRCKNCGSKMRISISKKKYGIYYYYKCLMKERSRGSRCNVKNLNGNEADEFVVNELKKMSHEDHEFYQFLVNERKKLNNLSSVNNVDKDKLYEELKECKAAIGNLTLQLAKNQDSKASKYIIEQIESFDDKIIEIQSKLEETSEKKETNTLQKINIDILINLVKDFSKNADELTFLEKKNMLKEIVDEITWDGETLEINVFPSFDK